MPGIQGKDSYCGLKIYKEKEKLPEDPGAPKSCFCCWRTLKIYLNFSFPLFGFTEETVPNLPLAHWLSFLFWHISAASLFPSDPPYAVRFTKL